MDVMDGLDAAMITGEALSSPMHVGALLIFTPPSDAGPHYTDDLHRQALVGGGEIDPRLRRRPHIGVDTLGMWTWQEVEVDLPEHMQARVLPPGSDEHTLWDLVAELHARPLDRSRPQWMAYLIDGLPGGRFAFYIKIHHTLVDGVEGMQMITDGLSTDPSQRSVKPFYVTAEHAPAEEPEPAGRPDPVAALRGLAGSATSAVGLARDLIGGGVDYLAGALSGASPLPLAAPHTPFNGRLGPKRSVAGGAWPLERVRSIQDATGVTNNDVVTAVVSGALRGWLAAHDALPGRSLIGFCPVSVRVEGEGPQAGHGNLFGLQQCPLGTDLADPAERLERIHRSMQFAKDEVARRGSAATTLLTVPNLLPTFLLSAIPLIPKWRNGYNVPISNVRGPRTDMYFNGAHLDSLYPISTVFDGLGLNATMCSYAETISFGYVAGRNLVPDIATLIPLTETAFAELESAVGVAGR
ncbi:MAG: wax ester/triacylglycerol synthase family O-acyltransferase [Mycobacterium sp.]